MKKHFALSLAVAAIALQAPAQGTIAYFSGGSFYVPVITDAVSLDLNQDGTADATFSGIWLTTADVPLSASSLICYVTGANGAQLLLNGGYAQVLAAGQEIAGSPSLSPATTVLTSFSWNLREGTSSGWTGPLGTAGMGYLGIQFSAQDGVHYGWIGVRLPFDSGDTLELSPAVLDWAYETSPDTAILAGAVPEPSVPLLFMAGAVAFAFWKRMKPVC